jgi:uncharacterized Ntn-hydrolase superfamily protein
MKLLHTYSIVALDKVANQLGVAVQSHWFSTGAFCPWIEPGVGVVATQSMVKVSYGPQGLTFLKGGKSSGQVLSELLKQDDGREMRQVAMVDAEGNVASHTGKKCIAEAGHYIGDAYSVQANMMLNKTVWSAMAGAYENSRGDLAQRLIIALEAAESEGGDIRGMQSASLLVAENIRDDAPWDHVLTNLRVDDHPEPITELKRLLDLKSAYDLMNEGDSLLSKNDSITAMEKYQQAAKLAPNIDEIPFWHAVTLADTGNMKEAIPIFKRIFKQNKAWVLLVQRLPKAGLLTSDPEVMHGILSANE